jgi:multicomponent Na+:H+ antiporter subunit E
VTVTLQSRRDTDIALLANLISLTPGTLSVDVADDKRFLYVHALLRRGDDVDELERELSTTLQRRLLAVLGRGEGRP